MASHDLAGGHFLARTMLSLDPATVTGRGYPLLLQTGKSFHGEEPLHDRQRPRDFRMELGAMYERAVSKHVGVELYAAPSGEPALGPVAFMHRPSAMDNPLAPIGDQWQDATHISFGVLTAGISHTHGSSRARPSTGANQMTVGGTSTRSDSIRTLGDSPPIPLNVGASKLVTDTRESPVRPTESVHRVTAVPISGRPLGSDGQWATTLLYGENWSSSAGSLSNSVLLESEAILDRSNTVFGRAEYVRKNAEEIAWKITSTSREQFDVGHLSLGYIRELIGLRGRRSVSVRRESSMSSHRC